MVRIPRIDKYGRMTFEPDVNHMLAPGRCTRCRQIHDSGPVEIVARYSDCSVWRCPNCNALIDDRPVGWGGSFEPIDKRSDHLGQGPARGHVVLGFDRWTTRTFKPDREVVITERRT